MSTVASLPPGLRQKLSSVTRRIHRLRALRGISLVLLVLAVSGGGALLADALFDLPAEVRRILLASWLGLGAVTALLGLVLPLFRRLDPEALAAVIEEKYPDLGERLTSTVELAGVP